MVIDTCTYTGHWPFRKLACETLAETAARAERAKITHIVCANLNAIFYIDPMEGNRELLAEIEAYRGSVKVLPFAVINPMYIEWQRDLRTCAALGFSGVQLTPQYHGYTLAGPEAAEAYRLAGELGLAVKIDVGFENIRQRAALDSFEDVSGDALAALLRRDPRPVTIVSTGHPAQMGAALADAVNARDNVFFNLIYPDSFTDRQLEACLQLYTAGRLCFGSQTPFRYIEPQYVKLFCSDAANDVEKEMILFKNLEGRIKGC